MELTRKFIEKIAKPYISEGKETDIWVSRDGRIFKMYAGINGDVIKEYNPTIHKDGYKWLVVTFFHESGISTALSVHQLVAEVYHGKKPYPFAEVNHINGDHGDNRAENLEWTSTKENAIHAAITGLNSRNTPIEIVEKICNLLDTGNITCEDIASMCGVKPGVVYSIYQGRSFEDIIKNHKFYIERFGTVNRHKKQIFINGEPWDYFACDDGTIRNLDDKIMHVNERGRVVLCHNKKHASKIVSRLIATAFIPNDDPKGKPNVLHKNGNIFDNRVENLAWSTQSEILQSAYNSGSRTSKYSESDLRKVCEYLVQGIERDEIEKKTGVKLTTINDLYRCRSHFQIIKDYPELFIMKKERKNKSEIISSKKTHKNWKGYQEKVLEYIKETPLTNKEIVSQLNIPENLHDSAYQFVKRVRKAYNKKCGRFKFGDSVEMIYNGEVQKYYITKNGIIMSDKGRKLIKSKTSTGYTYVSGILNGESSPSRIYLFKALGETFVKNTNPVKYVEIGFIDGDHKNYSVDNLKWVTLDEFSRYPALTDSLHHEENHNYKVTNELAEKICLMIQNHPDYSYRMIAEYFGVSIDSVTGIGSGRSFKNISKKYDFSARKFASTVKNQKITKMIFDGVPISALIHKIKKGTILKKKDIKKFIEYKRDELKENGFK